ncbi:hypothetical protein AnigIFM56816_004336 [Aspergillus niger]|nr:hypothetical protein AnigIFM56816_004336 [Aspergillus niger]
MGKYDLFPKSLVVSQKIMILEGDIGDEQLGIGSERFNWLIDWASVIFHVAAKVNFCELYQENHRDSIKGTRNIMNAAALSRRKPFRCMFSSIYVFGLTGIF